MNTLGRWLLAGSAITLSGAVLTQCLKPQVEKINSAVVDGNGNYWLRAQDGWMAYTSEGLEQGSFRGISFGRPDGKFYSEGYGEKGRTKVARFRENLPSMTVSKEGNGTISLDGKVSGEQEFSTFTRGIELLDHGGTDMLQDGKLDSVEIHYLNNYGPMRFGIKPETDPATSYVFDEIGAFCQNRINLFAEQGAKRSDVSDFGILAVFELKDAITFKELRGALERQSKQNKGSSIAAHGFFIKGELGETNTASNLYGIGCGYEGHKAPNPIGNLDLVSKAVTRLNTITKEDANRMADLLKDYYARTHIPFLMREGGVELGFWGTSYQVTVTPEE